MPTYTVRMVIRLTPEADQAKKYLYEERITAWNADSIEAAIDLAEKEAKEYADDGYDGDEALDLFQGYWLFDETNLIADGTEVFSLLRESDLEPVSYINQFFDTGYERQGRYSPAAIEESQNKSCEATGDDASN